MYKGDVDRLRRFWLTGVCKPYKEERQFSEPLATEQFLSAFLLLLSGIGLAVLLLGLEHIYFRYIRSHLAKTTTGACCSLISIVRHSSKSVGHESLINKKIFFPRLEYGKVVDVPWRRLRDAGSITFSSMPRRYLSTPFTALKSSTRLRPQSSPSIRKAAQ